MSRLLFMHNGADGFSVSRYAWSLRALPANLTAIWLLAIPKHASMMEDLMQGKAIKDMTARNKENKPASINKSSGLFAYFEPTHIIISSGDPTDSNIHLYRRKIGPQSSVTGERDNWKKQGPGEEKRTNTMFHSHLGSFKFSGVVVDDRGSLATMSWKWRQLSLDFSNWTMKDPSQKDNPQVADVVKGVPYFEG